MFQRSQKNVKHAFLSICAENSQAVGTSGRALSVAKGLGLTMEVLVQRFRKACFGACFDAFFQRTFFKDPVVWPAPGLGLFHCKMFVLCTVLTQY